MSEIPGQFHLGTALHVPLEDTRGRARASTSERVHGLRRHRPSERSTSRVPRCSSWSRRACMARIRWSSPGSEGAGTRPLCSVGSPRCWAAPLSRGAVLRRPGGVGIGAGPRPRASPAGGGGDGRPDRGLRSPGRDRCRWATRRGAPCRRMVPSLLPEPRSRPGRCHMRGRRRGNHPVAGGSALPALGGAPVRRGALTLRSVAELATEAPDVRTRARRRRMRLRAPRSRGGPDRAGSDRSGRCGCGGGGDQPGAVRPTRRARWPGGWPAAR